MEALATLFAVSFAAATLVPLPTEAALFAYIHIYPDRAALAVAIATAGNTAGGMTSYALGRLIPESKVDLRAVNWLRRYGHWAAALGFMATGRLARYIAVASFA